MKPYLLPGLNPTKSQMQAVLWTFTALAFLFVVFRLAVRVVSQRRLFVDDLLVITAWVILLTTAVIWQIKSPILYHFYLASAGKVPFTPEFALEYIQFMRYIAPLTILFYSGLWAVKFSFMAFFFKLNSQIKNHRIWWWVVFVVTAGVYIASVADIDYRCSFGSASTIMSTSNEPYCNPVPDELKLTHQNTSRMSNP